MGERAEPAWAEVLPAGWSIRPATEADLPAVTALVRALDERLLGSSDFSEDELRASWATIDPRRDTWLVLTATGEIAGYGDFSFRGERLRLQGDGYVHPDALGHGVGTALVRAIEARAREEVGLAPAGARVVLQHGVIAADERARLLLEREGYRSVRYFWKMELELDGTAPAPAWPDGITVRPVISEADEQRLFAAVDEAFRDHWGYVPQGFEAWVARKKAGGFDPSLWFMAEAGEEVAGAAVCGTEGGGAWVRDLAVRRPWRRRGLGRALLLHAVAEFTRRGERSLSLGVDAANPTGATALYESVGMRATQEFAVFEKELRPGRGEPGTSG